jgi:hypothetical protein
MVAVLLILPLVFGFGAGFVAGRLGPGPREFATFLSKEGSRSDALYLALAIKRLPLMVQASLGLSALITFLVILVEERMSEGGRVSLPFALSAVIVLSAGVMAGSVAGIWKRR